MSKYFSLLSRWLSFIKLFTQGCQWLLSYGSWIYNYLCNQCLSALKLWVRILLSRMRIILWNAKGNLNKFQYKNGSRNVLTLGHSTYLGCRCKIVWKLTDSCIMWLHLKWYSVNNLISMLKFDGGILELNQWFVNKGNNKITELRTILQRESQNS